MSSTHHDHHHGHSDHRHGDHAAHAADACCAHDAPAAAPRPVRGSAHFRIATMDCSAEEAQIRRALEPLDGIRSLGFQLGARTLSIGADAATLANALAAIRTAGFDPQPIGDSAGAGSPGGYARLAAALGLALAAEGVHFAAGDAAAWATLGMLLALGAIALAGIETYTKGFAALRAGRLDIGALMTVAVTGAFAIGQWPEAAMVMALYAIAERLEAGAVDRARGAIQSLMALAPDEALMREADGSWRTVPAGDVAVGAIVRIRPGERVPLDGTVTRGRGAIDESAITGESLPVEKGPGDPLFAGTVNPASELELQTTAPASDSTLARIVHAVEEAQGSRAATQRFVDRFAAVYTPAVFAIALAVALLAPWALGWSWPQAIYRALVLLVIACPCALVIATPVAIVSALATAARHGILIKGGSPLELARGLKAVALDKTGTVTEGKPRLVDWQALRGDRAQAARIAAALAARSDHPVSLAIARGLEAGPGAAAEVDGFAALPGLGVEGRIGNETWWLGNRRLIEEKGVHVGAADAARALQEGEGRSVALLASAAGVAALFAVADTVRPTSREAVAELKSLGVTTVMLSGDHPEVARRIAAEAGIAEARGHLLPADKLAAIAELQRRHGATAMAGDGINDAPALAQADVGIAMGGAGTHVAMDTAGIVIMNDDLRRIAQTIRLSRRTHAVLWQNIVFALALKAVFLVLAVAGSATMWMAVFADMGASLLVVANGLRLLRR